MPARLQAAVGEAGGFNAEQKLLTTAVLQRFLCVERLRESEPHCQLANQLDMANSPSPELPTW
jgi:hypothetical protein